jgi:uncharacterized protein YdaU (DUF1376 family)
VIEKPPAFLLYVNDLLASPEVDKMDSDQFRWYMTLLARAWHSDKPCHIPSDRNELYSLSRAKFCGISRKVFDRKIGLVLGRFKSTDDGKWLYNEKLLNQYNELEKKYLKRAAAAHERWRCNADAMHEQCNANQTKPKPIKEKPKDSCSEASSEPPTAEPVEKPVVVLPCVGKGSQSFAVMEPMIAEWRTAFPGVNVLGEIYKARAWLGANPKRQKTHSGMARFLVSWLSRAQDSGGNGNGTVSKSQARTEHNRRAAEEALRVIHRESEVPDGGDGGGDAGGDPIGRLLSADDRGFS